MLGVGLLESSTPMGRYLDLTETKIQNHKRNPSCVYITSLTKEINPQDESHLFRMSVDQGCNTEDQQTVVR